MSETNFGRLDRLYRELHAELLYFARKRLTNLAEAEDVVQEAFTKFQQRAEQEVIRNPRPYLYSSVVHLALNRTKVAKRHTELPPEDAAYEGKRQLPEGQVYQLTPERHVESRENLARVVQAITELPPQAQKAFLLHKVRNLSYAEVAVHMGLSKSTVEKHMIRALRMLGNVLEDPEDQD